MTVSLRGLWSASHWISYLSYQIPPRRAKNSTLVGMITFCLNAWKTSGLQIISFSLRINIIKTDMSTASLSKLLVVAENCKMMWKSDIDYFINTSEIFDMPQNLFNNSQVSWWLFIQSFKSLQSVKSTCCDQYVWPPPFGCHRNHHLLMWKITKWGQRCLI